MLDSLRRPVTMSLMEGVNACIDPLVRVEVAPGKLGTIATNSSAVAIAFAGTKRVCEHVTAVRIGYDDRRFDDR